VDLLFIRIRTFPTFVATFSLSLFAVQLDGLIIVSKYLHEKLLFLFAQNPCLLSMDLLAEPDGLDVAGPSVE